MTKKTLHLFQILTFFYYLLLYSLKFNKYIFDIKISKISHIVKFEPYNYFLLFFEENLNLDLIVTFFILQDRSK